MQGLHTQAQSQVPRDLPGKLEDCPLPPSPPQGPTPLSTKPVHLKGCFSPATPDCVWGSWGGLHSPASVLQGCFVVGVPATPDSCRCPLGHFHLQRLEGICVAGICPARARGTFLPSQHFPFGIGWRRACRELPSAVQCRRGASLQLGPVTFPVRVGTCGVGGSRQGGLGPSGTCPHPRNRGRARVSGAQACLHLKTTPAPPRCPPGTRGFWISL